MAAENPPPVEDSPLTRVLALYADYALCLEERRFDAWPGFFTESCHYEVQSRENCELDLPGAIVYCDSHGMLEDRVTVLKDMLTYPYLHIRHLISNVRVHGVSDGAYVATASYLVLHSTEEGETRIYSTGRYDDEIAAEAGGLRFRKKLVTADTFAIDNLLAVPL